MQRKQVDDHLRISAKDKPHLLSPASLRLALPKVQRGPKKQGNRTTRVRAAEAAFLQHRRRRCHRNTFELVDLKECMHLLRRLVVGASRCVGGVLGLGLALGRCSGSLTRRLGLGGGPESLAMESVRRSYIFESANSAYQVVAEQLHDESGVLVALLGECVELC